MVSSVGRYVVTPLVVLMVLCINEVHSVELQILNHLPRLEDVEHTLLSIDLDWTDEDIFHAVEFVHETRLKVEFLALSNCVEKTLRIAKFNEGTFVSHDFGYIKDPCMTYLLILEDERKVQELLKKQRHDQSYVFAIMKKNETMELYEVQYYSKKIEHLATWADNVLQIVSTKSLAERRSDFGGNTLRYVLGPYLDYDRGETIEAMALLSVNHNLTLVEETFEGYGTLLPNASWTGAIKQILHNRIDVASLKMTLTKDRRQVAQPGYKLDEETIVAIYNSKLQRGSLAWNLIINVFDKHVYVLIFVFITIISFFLAFSSWTFIPKQFFFALILTSKSLFSQSFDDRTFLQHNYKWSKKFQIWSVSFLGVFMFWYWTGLLTSELTIPAAEIPMMFLDDLNTRSRTDLTLMAYDGGVIASHIYKWAKQNPENEATFKESIQLVGDFERITEETVKGKNIIRLTGDLKLRSIFDEYKENGLAMCDFDQVELPEFGRSQVAWMYPKNSILQPLFDDFFNQLKEKGIKARADITSEKFCNTLEMIPVDVGFTSLIFMIMGLGIVASILTLLAEHCSKLIKKVK